MGRWRDGGLRFGGFSQPYAATEDARSAGRWDGADDGFETFQISGKGGQIGKMRWSMALAAAGEATSRRAAAACWPGSDDQEAAVGCGTASPSPGGGGLLDKPGGCGCNPETTDQMSHSWLREV